MAVFDFILAVVLVVPVLVEFIGEANHLAFYVHDEGVSNKRTTALATPIPTVNTLMFTCSKRVMKKQARKNRK